MTANMTNRDAKGKFVKATFKVGDKVRSGNNPEIGTITEFLNCGRECRVRFDPPWNMCHEVVQTLCKVEDAAPAELQPAPAPCPFKVGDRVTGFVWNNGGDRRSGAYQMTDSAGDIQIRESNGDLPFLNPRTVRKVEDTPANPEVVAKRYRDELHRTEAELREVMAERDSLRDSLEARTDALARVCRERDEAGRLWNEDVLRLKAAESQLSDIAAINRVAEIVNSRPEDSEDWHFQGLVADVLEGKVAA